MAAPIPGPSRSPRLRGSWPLVIGALLFVALLAFVIGPGGDGVGPAPSPRAEVPAVVTTPEVTPIARPPREADRPHRAPQRRAERPQSGDRHKAVQKPEEPSPAPLADPASAPVLTYAPAAEPAPESSAAPPAAPAPPPRPEFGIER